ncbi:hypothetical protein EFA69_16205 [Rufibacter immobilis]|uniref:Uncharacterized protein n=1 Tax=Rufibacter immobilis TaxID=1348778 RepID=A0A3M9MQ69_9BACT|nr:hypothetical protein [Rufibacter immobilis]RNI27660.1 hypothetical protein EFA69_16205 [Rufibacter immobilis]
MTDIRDVKEPLLVKNPLNTKHFNLMPLFWLTDKENAKSPHELSENIEEIIRFVTLYHHPQEADPMQLKTTLGFLFDLKDMFHHMTELK